MKLILDEPWALQYRVSLTDLNQDEVQSIIAALHAAAKEELYSRCPWNELPLSQRATTILQRNGLSTIGAVIACRPTRIRCLLGCGRTTREEIIAAFAAVNIPLLDWQTTHEAMAR